MAALGATNPTNWIVPKTAIKKFVGSFVAILLYHVKTKSKNSFYEQSKYLKIAKNVNLCLASRALRGEPQNEWAALAAAHEKVGKIPESQIVEYLYDFARTYFIRNS